MQKLKQRESMSELSKKQQTQKQYQMLLKQLISKNEPLLLSLQYCQKILSQYDDNKVINTFGEYSPKQICRLILKPQLKLIQQHFQRMPNKQCKIQHFLLILIQVIKFKFQQLPKFCIGIVQMFKQVRNRKTNMLQYKDFFYYVVGEVANLQQEQINTQFQVNFAQTKMQDFLMHDSGIKTIYYSKDLKLYLVLDENSDSIKIYNLNMRIISRYQPSKSKHQNRSPKIRCFDFNEFGSKLGLVLSDNTFQLINLPNYLNKSKQQFEKTFLDYIIYELPQPMKKLTFIQMTNTWLSLSQTNKILILNPQKSRQSQQKFIKEFNLFKQQKDQLKIIQILELVPLSTICIIAGNSIFFYNQNLSQKKFRNYKHGSNIKNARYCQQNNKIYIHGSQLRLTILSIERNSNNLKLSYYPFEKPIKDFEIFSHFQTILTTDEYNNVSLYDLKSQLCYVNRSFDHISKNKQEQIKILKTSKFQFIIFQSYMVSMIQQKITIQKQVQYNIDSIVEFDQLKEQILLSINNQILTFNFITGQIMKIYCQQNSYLNKYKRFFVDQNCQIVIFDQKMNLGYLKTINKQNNQPINQNSQPIKQNNQPIKQGDNFRHLQIDEFKDLHYDKKTRKVYIIDRNQIIQLKNQNKTFNIEKQLILHNFNDILLTQYNFQQKKLSFVTENQNCYVLDCKTFSLLNKYQFSFQKDPKMIETIGIIQFYQSFDLKYILLLTNSNKIYIFSTQLALCIGYVDLLDGVKYKQVDMDFKFTKMIVSETSINEKAQKKSLNKQLQRDNNQLAKQKKLEVMLSTEDGHFMSLDLTQFIKISSNPLNQTSKGKQDYKISKFTNKAKYQINNNQLTTIKIDAKSQIKFRLSLLTSNFEKRHSKQIIITKKIIFQKQLILTVSKDGQIKLSERQTYLSIMNLPNLNIKLWNMSLIQQTKIQNIVKQIKTIIGKFSYFWETKNTPKQILTKVKKSRPNQKNQLRKFNYNQPIPIDIQRKNVQDIVYKEMFYQTDAWKKQQKINLFSIRSHRKQHSTPIQDQMSRSYSHTWKKKKQFLQILQKAPSSHKYNKTIPKVLLGLRQSLDMFPKKQKLNPQQGQIKIIPQLKFYEYQPKSILKNDQTNENSDFIDLKSDNFDSSYNIQSRRKSRRSNVNDFDDIDKQFSKKNINFGKKIIFHHRKSPDYKIQSQIKYLNNLKINKEQLNPKKQYNPLSSVIQLFENHNKQIAGTKYGRQIKINKDMKQMRNCNFSSRY